MDFRPGSFTRTAVGSEIWKAALAAALKGRPCLILAQGFKPADVLMMLMHAASGIQIKDRDFSDEELAAISGHAGAIYQLPVHVAQYQEPDEAQATATGYLGRCPEGFVICEDWERA